MVVDVDVDKLTKLGMSADIFISLYLIYKKQYYMVKRYNAKIPTLTDEVLNELVNKKLIHNANKSGEFDPEKIIVRERFVETAIKKSCFFDELLEHFPVKVTRPDGNVDYLRSDLVKCKNLYSRITKGDWEIHNDILKYLDDEIRIRTETNQLKFMKKLPKWLDSEEWKLWEQRANDIAEVSTALGYGQSLE